MPSETDELDPMAMLEAAAAGTTASKGGKDKVVVDVTPEVEAQIAIFIAASKEADDASSRAGTAKAQILAHATRARVEALRRLSKVESTVSLGGRIEMCVQNRYSVIPANTAPEKERVNKLKGHFGADDFTRYFGQVLGIALKPASAANRDVLKKLQAAFGKDFAQHFDVKIGYKPTAAFHADVTLRPEVEALAQGFAAEHGDVIKIAEASLRLPGKKNAKGDAEDGGEDERPLRIPRAA